MISSGRQAVRTGTGLLALLAFALGGQAHAAPDHPDASSRLLVVGGSGLFGRFLPDGRHGGLARRAALLDSLRASHAAVLVVDAGDFVPVLSAELPDPEAERWRRSEVMARTLRQIGYAAWTPGETELSLGRDGLARLALAMGGGAVSANLHDRFGKAIFPASVVLTIGGWRVGVTGVTGPDVLERPRVVQADSTRLADFRLLDPDSSLTAVVAELAPRVDAVVCLAHRGAGAARRLAEAIPGIALVVAGHFPGYMASPDRAGNVPILRGGVHGREAVAVELALQPGVGLVGWRGVPLLLENDRAEDPTLSDTLLAFERGEAARYPVAGSRYRDGYHGHR